MSKLIDKYFKRGREFFNVEYPIISGAMTWISDPRLVSTVSNAGGLGCLACGNTPVDILEAQVRETQKLTDKPFALNLITIAPAYQDHLKLVQDLKLPYVIFAGGFPGKDDVQKVKDTGATVLCFASTESIAKRMVRYGAEGIILEGMEAGGHVGHVSLTILLQQVLFQFKDVPIFVAGGIATGKMSAHLMLMGASGVQLGTRFAVAKESIAHADFKEKFIRSNARDAISTPQFDSRLPVVAVRALRNKGHDEFSALQLDLLKALEAGSIHRHDAQMKVEEFWMGALRRAVIDGDISRGSLMAGQSVGLINKIQSVQEIVDELVEEIEEELQRVKADLNS